MKPQIPEPHPGDSYSVDESSGLRICISSKFPGGSDATGGAPLWEPLQYIMRAIVKESPRCPIT